MVQVNGSVVKEPGRRVEPDRDRVVVRGRPLPGRSALRYVVVHKPVGMITTLRDPEGRPTVRELLPPGPRLFPVGRLDADTSGLLLVTNDGDLAHKLMHPRYEVEKCYRVLLDRAPEPGQIARLREGVPLEPGVRSGPAFVRIASGHASRPTLDIRIHEGRYRQVRRMCEAVGLGVKALHRYGYGPLRIGRLPRGLARALTEVEVRRLRAAAARPGGTAPAAGAGLQTRRTPRSRSQPPAPPRLRRGPMGQRAGRGGYSGSRGRPGRASRPSRGARRGRG